MAQSGTEETLRLVFNSYLAQQGRPVDGTGNLRPDDLHSVLQARSRGRGGAACACWKGLLLTRPRHRRCPMHLQGQLPLLHITQPRHTHTPHPHPHLSTQVPPPPAPLQDLVAATGMAPPEGVLPQLAADMVALADRDGDGAIRWGGPLPHHWRRRWLGWRGSAPCLAQTMH